MARFTSPPSRALAVARAALDDPNKLIMPAPFADEEPPAEAAGIKEQLAAGRAELLTLANRLKAATSAKVMDQINLDIQRLRVHLMILNEADTGKSDPELHREMKLLRLMLADVAEEAPDEPEDPAAVERLEGATAVLDSKGINPDRAAQMVRLADALMRRTAAPDERPSA